MEMVEYLAVRGGGRVTDREISKALGLSKGAVYRGKKKMLVISYEVKSRRGGTWYGVCGGKPGAKGGGKPGAKEKPGAKGNILYIDHRENKERETRVREGAGQNLDAVKAAWSKYRGRALIEDEECEMAGWVEKLGEARLCELIALAWDRCTADGMSMYYVRHYFIEPALRGANKPGAKAPGAKKERKHEATLAPVKVTTTATKNRSEEKDEHRKGETVRGAENGTRKAVRAGVGSVANSRANGNGEVSEALSRLRRNAVPKWKWALPGSGG